MSKEAKAKIEKVLAEAHERGDLPVSIKNNRGVYVYANEGWSELAEAPIHEITSRRDDQLPWADSNAKFIQYMDRETRRRGTFNIADRRPHFQTRIWMRTGIERVYVPDERVLISVVEPISSDDFCNWASKVTERGIVLNGAALSIKQLYLLHQLLFHVPQKQTAREMGCSTTRINQYLRVLRDQFEADDNKELICALSASGLFPLLERFDLLFKHNLLADELKRQ